MLRLAISIIVEKHTIAFVGIVTFNNGLTVIICKAFTNDNIFFIDIFRNIPNKKFKESEALIALPALSKVY
jgi:hypothetical protein